MNAGRDLLLFIFFLIALWMAWFLSGGPHRTVSGQGLFVSPTLIGTSTGLQAPTISMPVPSPSGGAGSSTTTEQQAPAQPTWNVWNYFFSYRPGVGATAAPNASPYAPYVSLDPAQAKSADPGTEYVIVRTSPNLPQSVTVSGWVLENVSTGIRQAIGNASQIPYLGGVNTETPISVGPNATVIVTTGTSPNGASFRLNECTGYFGQFQTFTPSLPVECPSPYDEMLLRPATLAGDEPCREYVDTLSRCRFVTDQSTFPQGLSASCRDFVMNSLSYNGCIQEHKVDPTFYRNEWRVFLKRGQEMWDNDHGTIRLLDENGLLISGVDY